MGKLSIIHLCREANPMLNKEKCFWCLTSVKLLGHIVSAEGIEIDPTKIEAIMARKPPTNVKQLQEFLGMSGYYRKYIKGYADIVKPMEELLKKDVKWNWNSACMQSFEQLKMEFTKHPILRQANLELPFLLFTDASGVALGAVLSQIDAEGNEYVCAYASRSLKGAEIHYGITEKECLAVVWAIKYFRIYLYGAKFQVITDHSALLWLMSISDPTGRLARWSLYLQAYQFEIIHRKGKKHTNVDALSRPVLMVKTRQQTAAQPTNELEDFQEKCLDP